MTAEAIFGTETPAPPVDTVSKEAQVVYLLDDCVKVTVNGIDKYLSHEVFLAIIEKSIGTERDAVLEGMLLPNNTFYFARSSNRVQLSCYYPGGVRDVNYLDTIRKSVIPNIVVSHTLEKREDDWIQSESRYYCTDISVGRLPARVVWDINAADHIFLLPFTNTYASAQMCYGDNTMPRRFTSNNLRGLDWYYQFLFAGAFNNDLGVKAINTTNDASIRAWYDTLATIAEEGGKFPYERLNGYPKQS